MEALIGSLYQASSVALPLGRVSYGPCRLWAGLLVTVCVWDTDLSANWQSQASTHQLYLL